MKIKQLREAIQGVHFNPIEIEKREHSLIYKDANFSIDCSYCLKFSVVKKSRPITVSVRLIKNGQIDKDFIQLGLLTIESTNNENENENIELYFRPSSEGYDEITFVPLDMQNITIVETEESSDKAYAINNIIEKDSYISQIGVQGKSDFSFIINGEKITVGRTGMYELPIKDFKIDFLGVLPTEEKFIIDYREESIE